MIRSLATLILIVLGIASGTGSGQASQPLLTPGFAVVEGDTIAYHISGSGPFPGSGPVVLVHPGGPGLEWSFVRMPKLEQFATAIYIEPIGTGRSGRLARPNEYTMDRYVRDVEGLRAHLGIDKIVFLGHSHGGFVAQAYALAHGDHVRGLILYDTSPTTGPEWQKDVESNVQWFRDEPWFRDAADALAHETSAKTDDEITAIFKREMPLYFAEWTARAREFEPHRRAVRLTVAPGQATNPDSPAGVGVAPVFEVRDRLRTIAVPTLVIVGKRDFVTSEKFAHMLHEGIHGSKLLVLERSGHMGHIEEPDAFTTGIRSFLRSLPFDRPVAREKAVRRTP